ncbi:MAG: tRNA (adenosine(37)-N6)-threonylcarbamoyltransferase complex dimerization subunit type 1 TsaB [Micavibrio sp.]|nr:tRNA (adenosine(37)-N6)-threonylcarbamoyltransferase complex dimerization subunit type 1 TsaB [Micavibrio sp.]
MICLAVNTANMILSVALVSDGKVLHSYETTETRDQGNLLLRHVQQALDANGMTYANIDLLAVVTGPGSFTGIRIGLAAMRALALATGKPVTGLSSFEIFAMPAANTTNIIAVESWREELYFSVQDSAGKEVIPDVNETPQDFARRIAAIAGPYVVTGDAAEKLREFLPDATFETAAIAPAHVADLAARKQKSGAALTPPVPYYLREADVSFPKK